MGARSIQSGDYDWIRVALAANEDSSDEPVFGRGNFVLADDGACTCEAGIMEKLVQ